MLGAPGLMSSLGLPVCRYLRVPGDLLASWNSDPVAMLGAPGLVTSRLYAICVSPAPWNADLVAMLGAPGLMSSLGLLSLSLFACPR